MWIVLFIIVAIVLKMNGQKGWALAFFGLVVVLLASPTIDIVSTYAVNSPSFNSTLKEVGLEVGRYDKNKRGYSYNSATNKFVERRIDDNNNKGQYIDIDPLTGAVLTPYNVQIGTAQATLDIIQAQIVDNGGGEVKFSLIATHTAQTIPSRKGLNMVFFGANDIDLDITYPVNNPFGKGNFTKRINDLQHENIFPATGDVQVKIANTEDRKSVEVYFAYFTSN